MATNPIREGKERVGRRRILATLGGIVGLAIGRIAIPDQAEAADGDALILGRRNLTTSTTKLKNTTPHEVALKVRSHGRSSVAIQGVSNRGTALIGDRFQGTGVWGGSTEGTGVDGQSFSLTSVGVRGNSVHGFGIEGESYDNTAVSGSSRYGTALAGGNISQDHPAISGAAQDGQTGVMGLSSMLGDDSPEIASPDHVGVFGVCDRAQGRGVVARSKNGLALETKGRVKFSTCGVANIPSGSAHVEISVGTTITPTTRVLATLQANPGEGAWLAWARPDALRGTIDVHLSKQASNETAVAWFLME